MKKMIARLLLISFCSFAISEAAFSQAFDKDLYYAAMSSNSIEKLNEQLKIIKVTTVNSKDAYEGALLMKKAGLVNTAKEKLNLFKTGRRMLDAMIKKDTNNAEFRFLRVMIQENAPKLVNYRSELQADCAYIVTVYKKLSASLQQVILQYSQHSKNLHAKDF